MGIDLLEAWRETGREVAVVGLGKSGVAATRLLAIIGKELVEVVRRPGAVLSLIVGPFLIMALFGVGYQGYRAPLRTVLVIPPESGLSTDIETYRTMAAG